MKRFILKFAMGALMLMGSGLASAVLLGSSVSFENGIVTGDLVAITASTPNPTTVAAGNEFSVCVDGPGTDGCSSSGLFFTIDVGDSAIDFLFFGSTGAGESFSFDLVFGPGISIVSFDQDNQALVTGSFILAANMNNVLSFEGSDNGDGNISAVVVGGVAIHIDLEVQQVPEPGPLALLALALAGMGFARRRIAL